MQLRKADDNLAFTLAWEVYRKRLSAEQAREVFYGFTCLYPNQWQHYHAGIAEINRLLFAWKDNGENPRSILPRTHKESKAHVPTLD